MAWSVFTALKMLCLFLHSVANYLDGSFTAHHFDQWSCEIHSLQITTLMFLCSYLLWDEKRWESRAPNFTKGCCLFFQFNLFSDWPLENINKSKFMWILRFLPQNKWLYNSVLDQTDVTEVGKSGKQFFLKKLANDFFNLKCLIERK